MDNYDFFDEKNFYSQFIEDLLECEKEVYIESPFITSSRMEKFYPIFAELVNRGIDVYLVTRSPEDHIGQMATQAEYEIRRLERLGVQVIIGVNMPHRKVAILDRKVTWEGSLNILSQSYSREMMRRTDSKKGALKMISFLRLDRIL